MHNERLRAATAGSKWKRYKSGGDDKMINYTKKSDGWLSNLNDHERRVWLPWFESRLLITQNRSSTPLGHRRVSMITSRSQGSTFEYPHVTSVKWQRILGKSSQQVSLLDINSVMAPGATVMLKSVQLSSPAPDDSKRSVLRKPAWQHVSCVDHCQVDLVVQDVSHFIHY